MPASWPPLTRLIANVLFDVAPYLTYIPSPSFQCLHVVNFVIFIRLSSISSFFQVIAAIGEQKASKALQEAATVIAESPSALQVGRGKNRQGTAG